MEWVASTLHTTSEHGASSITTADAHTSAASSRLNWHPRRFKWTRPFRRKTKSGFCACAITFQTQSTSLTRKLLQRQPPSFDSMVRIPPSAETSSDWARAISSTDANGNILHLVRTLVEVWSRSFSNTTATGRTTPFLTSSKAENNAYNRRKHSDFPV
jgi:hypothetical protein